MTRSSAASEGFRPDFLVIGAMKAATSTVSAYLEEHPDVFMVPRLDPNFFSRDEVWSRGRRWYGDLFSGRKDEILAGEGSNSYTMSALHPQTADRILALCPDVKLVYMVRHPVERLLSAWVQKLSQGDPAPPTPDRAVIEAWDLFVDPSLYWKQIQIYRERFSHDRIFIGFLEEMEADQPAFFSRLCLFLGVPPHRTEPRHVNPSQGKRVPSGLQARLRTAPGVRAAAHLLPLALRQSLKSRLLTRVVQERPALSPAVRAKVLEAVAPDAAALLAHCGRPLDFWDLGEA